MNHPVDHEAIFNRIMTLTVNTHMSKSEIILDISNYFHISFEQAKELVEQAAKIED